LPPNNNNHDNDESLFSGLGSDSNEDMIEIASLNSNHSLNAHSALGADTSLSSTSSSPLKSSSSSSSSSSLSSSSSSLSSSFSGSDSFSASELSPDYTSNYGRAKDIITRLDKKEGHIIVSSSTPSSILSINSDLALSVLLTPSSSTPSPYSILSKMYSTSSPSLYEASDPAKSFENNDNSKVHFCPRVFKRNLFWNYTRNGEVLTQKCPDGAHGIARWQCDYLTGTWFPERPDLIDCESPWLDNLEKRLNNRDEPVVNIITELSELSSTKQLFSKDLKSVVDRIDEALNMVTKMKASSMDSSFRFQTLKELLVPVVKIVSNLLSSSQSDAWLDLDNNTRKWIAFRLLKTLQRNALLLADNTNRDGSFSVAEENACKYLAL